MADLAPLEVGVAWLAVSVGVALGLRHGGIRGARLWAAPLIAIPVGVVLVLFVNLVRQAGSAWVSAPPGLGSAAGGGGVSRGIALLALGLGAFVAGVGVARARRSADVHRRGAVVVPYAGPPRVPVPWRGDPPLTLAGVPVTALDETKHFKLMGTTGSGKSTAIRELLGGALERGDRAVFADPDGGYLGRFHDRYRGDVILNPFDARSARWDLFGEIGRETDIESLARALIPEGEIGGREWRAYARTLVASLIRAQWRAGSADVGELWRRLAIAEASELQEVVQGTPAQPFLETGNERMFGSIRSVATSQLAPLSLIAESRGAPFAVRTWLRNTRPMAGWPAPVLFLPYRAGEIAALRSLIATWMRLAIFGLMDGGEGDSRTWLVVDELDALGAIDGLKDALARLRKFGGRCVLGFQSIAQVSETYGLGVARTITENCGNTLILRCSASEGGGTAEFASTLIGEREVARKQLSSSRRSDQAGVNVTRSEQVAVERAVLAAEIECFPDGRGVLKLAESPVWIGVAQILRKADAGRPN